MKTHIRKMQDNHYFGEWDLPIENNGKMIVTIVKVAREELKTAAKDIKAVVYIKEHTKGIVINSTNQKAITHVIGSPFIEDWIGKQVELYRLEKLKAFGEIKDAVRVSSTAPKPKEKEELTETHARFEGAVKAIKEGKVKIEDVEKTFNISEITKNKITELCK